MSTIYAALPGLLAAATQVLHFLTALLGFGVTAVVAYRRLRHRDQLSGRRHPDGMGVPSWNHGPTKGSAAPEEAAP
jgi:hypothetical protein